MPSSSWRRTRPSIDASSRPPIARRPQETPRGSRCRAAISRKARSVRPAPVPLACITGTHVHDGAQCGVPARWPGNDEQRASAKWQQQRQQQQQQQHRRTEVRNNSSSGRSVQWRAAVAIATTSASWDPTAPPGRRKHAASRQCRAPEPMEDAIQMLGGVRRPWDRRWPRCRGRRCERQLQLSRPQTVMRITTLLWRLQRRRQ